jgi:hypothetical protein
MNLGKMAALVALAVVGAACSQGNSDNVMAPEANALEPADVNAALGPEITNTGEANMSANETTALDNNSAAQAAATNNATE